MPRKKIELTNENIRQAVDDLEINSPIHRVRLVGNRLELWLRDGIVKWPETSAEKRKRLAAKPKPKARAETGRDEPDPPGDPEEWPSNVPRGA